MDKFNTFKAVSGNPAELSALAEDLGYDLLGLAGNPASAIITGVYIVSHLLSYVVATSDPVGLDYNITNLEKLMEDFMVDLRKTVFNPEWAKKANEDAVELLEKHKGIRAALDVTPASDLVH